MRAERWARAGEAKIKKAKQLGTQTIDEDGLFDLIRASCPRSNAQDATSLLHRPQRTVIGEDLASNIQAQEARRESTSVSGGDLPSPSADSEAPVSSRRRTLRTVQHSRSASHVGDDDSLSSDPGDGGDDDDDYRGGGGGGGGSDGSDDEAASSSQAVRPVPHQHWTWRLRFARFRQRDGISLGCTVLEQCRKRKHERQRPAGCARLARHCAMYARLTVGVRPCGLRSVSAKQTRPRLLRVSLACLVFPTKPANAVALTRARGGSRLPAVWCVHDAANKPFAALACGCQSFA